MRCEWIPDSREKALAMWRQQWVPHPRQSVTEWAEANLSFSSRFTSSPGPFRVRSYPYMREWLDCFHPASGVRSMALLCGAQVAKSTAIQVGMAYRLVRAPAPAAVRPRTPRPPPLKWRAPAARPAPASAVPWVATTIVRSVSPTPARRSAAPAANPSAAKAG